MTLRLRVWLSTLAVCLIPSTALAQRYAGQPALAPVALEARQSLGDLAWDPMIRVAALTPPTIRIHAAESAGRPPAAAATKVAPPVTGTKATAKKSAAKKSRCPALAAAEQDRFLAGYVLTDSLDLAAAVEPAAVVPAIDRALAVLAQEEPLDVVTGRGSASPVIVTLPQAEEYLPYDLAALDRLQLRLFPYGLPHYLGPLMPLVYARGSTEVAQAEVTQAEVAQAEAAQAEVAQAEVAQAEVAAEAGGPLEEGAAPAASLVADVPSGLPVDCLLDDLFWHANQLLDQDAVVHRQLQPYELGRRLARVSYSSAMVADRWVPRLAAAVAPQQPVLVGPPRPQAAAANLLVLTPAAVPQPACSAAPSVCCPPPANPTSALAEVDLPQPPVGQPAGDLRAEVLRSAADSLEALAAAMRSLSDQLDHRRLASQPVAGPHVR